jgi:hypothetical protein
MDTKDKLLFKEADNRVLDAIKVLANSKASLDQGQTMLVMNLSYHFQKLYGVELGEINSKVSEAIKALNDLAQKIRVELKQ